MIRNIPRHRIGSELAYLLSLLCLAISARAQAWDDVIDSVMYRSPELPKAKAVPVFSEQAKALWITALQRPEADYQCQAAVTIILAHQHGMTGLDGTVEPLLKSLERADQNPEVRLAAAQALIELDARTAAAKLFQQAQVGDQGLRNLVEPTLADWDYRPAREVWLKRLAQPDFSNDDVLLAVRAMATVGEEKAIPQLRELVHSRLVPAPLRVEAARALGNIVNFGLEAEASRLLENISPHETADRLAAANLLRHHKGHETVRLLGRLAHDPQPAVARIALTRLMEIDPKLVVRLVEESLRSYDAPVRILALEGLRIQPTDQHIRSIADRFHDAHPAVRVKARHGLRELATMGQHHDLIIDQAMRLLGEKDWRPQEQSVILLAQVDYKPAASGLVELLKSERAEVLVAAAWGIKQLAVPETLQPSLEHFRELTKRRPPVLNNPNQKDLPLDAIDQQLSQLAQLFGQKRYRPADSALRLMVPRPGDVPNWPGAAGIQTRVASIWALGLIHEGKPVDEVGQALVSRLSDLGGPGRPPEDYRVRWMSAVSLGRMKAADHLPVLRRFCPDQKPSLDPVNNACGWAIERITGQRMPPPGTVQIPGEPFHNWLRGLGNGNQPSTP
jgi:HEAT repeat protein